MQRPWYNGLRVQIVALLTLALFPLGAVAVYQTSRIAAEARKTSDAALLALTSRAAKKEELIIERAFGAARFFGAVAEEFANDPEWCRRNLARFVQKNEDYGFIGILPASGIMRCSSTGEVVDLSQDMTFQRKVASQARTIVAQNGATAADGSLFVVSEPFETNGTFAGFISVSINNAGDFVPSEGMVQLGLEELITFNDEGTLLTARADIAAARNEIPSDRALAQMATSDGVAFNALNAAGETRTYTVVSVKGSPVTIMGVWRQSNTAGDRIASYIKPTVFPVLMWFASMAVAMLAIHTLVLRHISRLRRDMTGFSRDRRMEEDEAGTIMPNELQALKENLDSMARNILQDEAELEDAVREKVVLIKEVHHRVKNNLQLISSIMNMQIRAAEHEETKSVLSRVQDRVLSLATIHRDLYQSRNGGGVDVGSLISEIVHKSLEFATSSANAVELTTDFDNVSLFPDQAVPLSLLAAEATTNAIKYLGAPAGQKPWIKATLKQDGQTCVMVIENSLGPEKSLESTGLGSQLINAFSIQLGGKIDIENTASGYLLRVTFRAEEFVPETRDF